MCWEQSKYVLLHNSCWAQNQNFDFRNLTSSFIVHTFLLSLFPDKGWYTDRILFQNLQWAKNITECLENARWRNLKCLYEDYSLQWWLYGPKSNHITMVFYDTFYKHFSNIFPLLEGTTPHHAWFSLQLGKMLAYIIPGFRGSTTGVDNKKLLFMDIISQLISWIFFYLEDNVCDWT